MSTSDGGSELTPDSHLAPSNAGSSADSSADSSAGLIAGASTQAGADRLETESDQDLLDDPLVDEIARLRQGIILGFILLVGVGIASIVLAVLGRSEVAALQDQVAALQQAAASTAAAPAPQPAPNEGAAPNAAPAAPPGIAEPIRLAGLAPQGADEFGALLIGNRNGGSVVEVFIDFQCPFCQRWDRQIGDALIARALMEGSDVLVKINPLAFLGETTPDLSVPGASARAANAAACIAEYEDPAVLARYVAAVYAAADPNEPAGQFPESQLAGIATDAGAGTQTTECIRTEDFMPYVAEVTRNSFVRGVGGTPTVVLNGSMLPDPFESRELKALVTSQSS